MPEGFHHRTRVTFAQVDAAGIVYFSRIFEMCHEAYEAALAAAGYPLSSFFGETRWVMPLAHAEADFRWPMRLGDDVDVWVTIEDVGGTSIRWRFELRGSDGKLRATVRHVHVAVDRETFRARPIPDEFVAAVKGLEAKEPAAEE